MNVYSELLELLSPRHQAEPPVLLGVIRGVSPLTLEVRGTAVTEGLMVPRGTVFCQEDVGSEVALLPCGSGFLLLFQVEGGET